jgi:death-on-curing family protein
MNRPVCLGAEPVRPIARVAVTVVRADAGPVSTCLRSGDSYPSRGGGRGSQMGRHAVSFRTLADRAEMDYDEALVTVWDAGVEEVEDLNSTVPARLVPNVERALGLVPHKDMQSIDFWEVQLGLSGQTLRVRLAELGVNVGPNARKLPKGGLRKLRQAMEPTPPEEPRRTERIPDLCWTRIGAEREVRLLTEDEVLAIHGALVDDFARAQDPIWPPGLREPNLLSSAVTRPGTSLGDTRKYPTVEMAAAALMHSLIHNHPFHNGNKRTGLVALLVFLDENGVTLDVSQQELFRFTLRVAQHGLVPRDAGLRDDREVLEIARWIKSHCRGVDTRSRPIKWVRFERLLRSHGCRIEPTKVGNQILITRRLVRRRRFLGEREEVLRSVVARSNLGSDAVASTVEKVRRELKLDREHGVDTARFLEGTAEDEFILEYRHTLHRLAKL